MTLKGYLCRCGMQPLVLGSTRLRVTRHLFILYAHIIKKIFRYKVSKIYGVTRTKDAKLLKSAVCINDKHYSMFWQYCISKLIFYRYFINIFNFE